MAVHARLSPSGADRWQICTASVALIERLIAKGELRESDLEGEEQISEEEIIEQNLDAYEDVVLDPTRESTSFSAEGTVMHEVRASCLYLDLDPQNFVGQKFSADGFSFVIDEDMADRLVEGIDWIRENTSSPFVERRVNLSDWLPGQYGFCDTYWLHRDTLFVSDFKNGVGEPVAAVGNRQLRFYALGAWFELGCPKIKKVVLNIDQPRAGGMKFWDITFAELMEFGEEAKRVYKRIEAGQVEFAPTTKGCRWCPVRKTKRGCAAFNQWNLWMLGNSLLDVSEGDPKFADPMQIPRAMRYYIVKNAAGIRAWLAKLHDESLNAAIAGDPDPGSKAIEGSGGNRFFTDEQAAERIITKCLGDDAYKPKKIIGFTEIDRLMKPGRKKQGFPDAYEELLELVDRGDPKPKLVPADHPAPAYVHSLEDEFEEQDMLEDDFDEI